MAGMLGSLFEWFSENQVLMGTLFGVSLGSLLLALLLLPRIVAKLPADHFKERRRKRKGNIARRIGKNLLGVLFVALGVLLLVLPGQGVLTLLVGVMLLDFPGKHAVERWIVMRKGVRRFLNRMRTKRGQPEFEMA